jgi:site-specific DNA-methyltransferase (adenine-specific)
MGSGTTAKVGHRMNRRWLGSEISAEYVAIAKERLAPYLDKVSEARAK